MGNLNILKMLILLKIINKFFTILIKMPKELAVLWLIGFIFGKVTKVNRGRSWQVRITKKLEK